VWAAYADFDIHPVRKPDIDFAGRFEHYTAFANTHNGKIWNRYDFTRRFAIRGAISNGFRAPTLAEEHLSSLNVSPTGASGDLAASSAAAQSIGAVPLSPSDRPMPALATLPTAPALARRGSTSTPTISPTSGNTVR
jgi:iron complex outermembrane receptor protein